jgi:opacity protein-like surface antigen
VQEDRVGQESSPSRTAEDRYRPKAPRTIAAVDKSMLALREPRRYRDKAHRNFVCSQPCLVCGPRRAMPIILASRSRVPSASRSAMSSRSRCAGDITANNRWISTLAARFGWAFDRWLLYGKAGGGWVGNDNFTITNTQTGASFNFSNNSNNTGWLVGVGTEWAFVGNWSARLEYDYLGLSSRTFNGDGLVFPANDTFNSDSRNVQMVTFGINYRFGWGGPAVAS